MVIRITHKNIFKNVSFLVKKKRIGEGRDFDFCSLLKNGFLYVSTVFDPSCVLLILYVEKNYEKVAEAFCVWYFLVLIGIVLSALVRKFSQNAAKMHVARHCLKNKEIKYIV